LKSPVGIGADLPAIDLNIAFADEAWVLGTYSMVFAATREFSPIPVREAELIDSIIRWSPSRPVPTSPNLYHRVHWYRRFLSHYFFHGKLDRLLRPSSFLCFTSCPYHSIRYQYDRYVHMLALIV
jgi:hypothetical protein